MTKLKRHGAWYASEVIIVPGRGRPLLHVPVYAGGYGETEAVHELPQKMRKLLRSLVAFKMQRRKKN